MEKFYGHYLGICISRMDPEFRGRVKIFIPEVHPTLYEKWNKDGRDVMINCVGDNIVNSISTEIREKLERVLPFAEAASPIFGSSAPGFLNNAANTYSQTADVGQQSFTGNPDANAISTASNPLATRDGGLRPSNELNGRLNTSNPIQLTPLGDYVQGAPLDSRFLNPYVEGKFKELCLAYRAETGKTLIISDAYRNYDRQVKLAKEKGIYPNGLAARPGKSNHGLGCAVDINGPDQYGEEVWMFKNASRFGFSTITKQGPGSSEAWHWELPPNRCPPEAFAYTMTNNAATQATKASTAETPPNVQ